jgi:hypothetical protein
MFKLMMIEDMLKMQIKPASAWSMWAFHYAQSKKKMRNSKELWYSKTVVLYWQKKLIIFTEE